ncbi:hypothetical protein RV15_GL001941 [Enterococcus silesiacus]|uniref:Flavodoxin-like fold domain-containing protein n=1 Tax=Enterococcus silesiacus TaxID=332949 RepID=A0AA91G8D9_9ENTE|nr:hypothetical protein RV15_GL001941 [Enterococcus silesiacus]
MNKLLQRLEKEGAAYQLIDLNKDQFDPVFSEKDLALFSKGETTDPLVHRYQKILGETNELFIIAPTWWYEFPAIVKGFFDKVMLKNIAYDDSGISLKGLFTNIKTTTIINTGTAPKWYLKYVKGNYVKTVFIKGTLKDIGIKNVKWKYIDINRASEDKRTQFLERV